MTYIEKCTRSPEVSMEPTRSPESRGECREECRGGGPGSVASAAGETRGGGALDLGEVFVAHAGRGAHVVTARHAGIPDLGGHGGHAQDPARRAEERHGIAPPDIEAGLDMEPHLADVAAVDVLHLDRKGRTRGVAPLPPDQGQP